MKRKIFLFVFALIIVATPAMSRASFFDFLKFDWKNLGAQAKTAVTADVRPEAFMKGDKDPEVQYIQELLAKKGYYGGKINGVFGSITQKSVTNWQTKNGLKVTGKLDQSTVESIAGVREESIESRGGGFFLANIKMFLGGSYNSGTGLMSTALNDANLIPVMEPYSALGHSLENDGIEMDPGVLDATGPNAIVDWVVVELRDANHMHNVEYARAALLQADGDIVEVDGVSPITINNLPSQNYYVLVAHRNHLPIITQTPIDITGLVDMTIAALYNDVTMPGTSAKMVNGKQVLWPGDVNRDNHIIYTGADNDRDPILAAIGGTVPTATLSGQYRLEDVNMDGIVKYTGANNDRDIILQTIGGTVPTAVLEAQLPELYPIMVELISTEETAMVGGGMSDTGTFEITFEVTALENDIVIPEASELVDSALFTNEGAEYGILTSGGQPTMNLSSVLVNNTDADLAPGGGYLISEGDTEEFTLTIVFQPQADGLFKVYLDTINWGFYTGNLNADEFYTIDLGYNLGSSTEFDTDYIFLNAI